MAHYRSDQEARRRRLKHYLEYGLLRAVMLLLGLLPLGLCLFIARRLGDAAFSLVRFRRRVTLENLHAAFGDRYTGREYVGIARRCYRNFAMTFVEILRFERESQADLVARTDLEGLEHMQAAQARGKGIVYLTAHVGNWESMGAVIRHYDHALTVISGDQKNLFVDRLIKRIRAKIGMQQIPIGSSLKAVLRVLRANGRVALVADQDAGRDGLFIPFFGRLASTSVGPARFAVRTGASVVIGLDRRTTRGRHVGRLYPPIVSRPEAPAEEEERRILAEYTRVLEEYVRAAPEEWFWMHRRWKTRPEAPQRLDVQRGAQA
jgi:Kdo2-lipid IVA lauroyltransferase/acyltransferase